jgi:hypothetical protein
VPHYEVKDVHICHNYRIAVTGSTTTIAAATITAITISTVTVDKVTVIEAIPVLLSLSGALL